MCGIHILHRVEVVVTLNQRLVELQIGDDNKCLGQLVISQVVVSRSLENLSKGSFEVGRTHPVSFCGLLQVTEHTLFIQSDIARIGTKCHKQILIRAAIALCKVHCKAKS